ncbi:MAG: DUF4126 domain-containing protein [Bryobacteraceae bacterium]
MPVLVLAFLIGVVAGLRALTPVAAVSWAAWADWLNLQGTPLGFLRYIVSPVVFTIMALGEIVNDKLPKTPSRKAPASFGVRIVMGAFSGTALGAASQSLLGGLVMGALGAVVGTFAGYEARMRLTRALGGRNLPIALLEDLVAIIVAVAIVVQFK